MSDELMRVTTHNARSGKNGAFSPKHNDRNFDLENASNIDKARTSENWYWHRYYDQNKSLDFDTVEKIFYTQTFSKALEARNERYREQRHPERMQTIDEYRSNPRSCPEETILQIGNLKQAADPKLLREICIEYVNWEQKTFPNIKLLTLALHLDEQGAPHFHERKAWIGHDKDGNPIIGQDKALREMGIKPPDPSKKLSKFNNPKITYTRICREKFMEICRSHGLELEEKPKEATKSGLTLLEYQSCQERQKMTELSDKVKDLESTKSQLAQAVKQDSAQLREMSLEQTQLQKELESKRLKLDTFSEDLKDSTAVMTTLLDHVIDEVKLFERTQAVSTPSQAKTDAANYNGLEREIRSSAFLSNGFFGNGKVKIELSPSSYETLLKAFEQLNRLLYMFDELKASAEQAQKWQQCYQDELGKQQEFYDKGQSDLRKTYSEEIRLGNIIKTISKYHDISKTLIDLYNSALYLEEHEKIYGSKKSNSTERANSQQALKHNKSKSNDNDYEI